MSDIQVLSRAEFGGNSTPVFNPIDQVVEGQAYAGGITPLSLIPKTKRGASWAMMSFSTELAGNSVVGVAPREDDLFMACGMKKAVGAGVSVTYSVTGLLADLVTNVVAVDIDLYKGNALKMACNDSVGTFSIMLRPAEAVELAWSFNGRYEAPTEAAGVAVAFTTGDPVVAAGLTSTLNTETVVIKEASIALNGTNNSPNFDIASTAAVAAPRVTGHLPTFTVTVERPAIGTLDLHALWVANTKMAFTAVIGTVAGNICTITIDGYQNAPPQDGWDSGVGMQTITCDMSWIAADTQLQLVYT